MPLPPEDDALHQPEDASNFNESMYFNFYDRSARVGGFMRIGNRVNEGHAEMTLCVYLPNGHALFDYQRYPIASNRAWDAGRMSFELIDPLMRHRTRYEGSPIEMADPMVLLNPGNAFRTSPRTELRIDLVHEATAEMFEPPPYGLEHAFSLELPSLASAGDRRIDETLHPIQKHNEQHMRMSGTITVGGEQIRFNGLGMRDHSWGPRTWGAGGGHSRWLTICLNERVGMMVQDLGRGDGSTLLTGVVVRDGKFDWMRRLHVHTERKDRFQEKLEVDFETEGGEVGTLFGRVITMVPLRHMGETTVTRVGEGLTEYRLGNLAGFGLSEYFDTYPLGPGEA